MKYASSLASTHRIRTKLHRSGAAIGNNSFDHHNGKCEVVCLCFLTGIRNGSERNTRHTQGRGKPSCCVCYETYPALSSSSSFEPDAVFVGRSSSGRILDPLLLLSSVVSASFLVWATFSIMLPPPPVPVPPPPPPVVISDRCGLRAALCFRALLRNAWRLPEM